MTLRPIVSLAEADAYFADRLRSASWITADETAKRQALTQASTFISGGFVFYDNASSVGSDGSRTWDSRVTAAVCEEAIFLLENDPGTVPEFLTGGIASANVGSLSVTFSKEFVCPWICEAAKLLIGDLGVFIGDDAATAHTTSLSL